MTSFYVTTSLRDETLLSRPDGQEEVPQWFADDDAALGATIEARNVRLAVGLIDRYPGLAHDKSGFEPEDYADERLTQKAVLLRYQRSRILFGPWSHGHLEIRLLDGHIRVGAVVSRSDPAAVAAFRTDYAALLSGLASDSGMRPLLDDGSVAPDADTAVARLLDMAAPTIGRLRRSERRRRLMRACALPGVFVTALIALAIALSMARGAWEQAGLLTHVDPEAELTFVTEQSLPIVRHYGLFPAFVLQGRVANHARPVVLEVFRDEYLRAGPGAPYPVLPTGDPESPFMLRSRYENSLPLVPVAGRAMPWHALLALLPLLLWYLSLAHPLIKALPRPGDEVFERIGSRLAVGIGLLALFVVVVLLKS